MTYAYFLARATGLLAEARTLGDALTVLLTTAERMAAQVEALAETVRLVLLHV